MTRKRLGIGVVFIALSAKARLFAAQPIDVTFGGVLSDFTGPVRVGEARIAIDGANREVFVGEARDVRVFNDAGMAVFKFQIASGLGAIRDLAVLPSGEILALAYDLSAPGDRPRFVLARHDYRGGLRGEVALTGIPAEFADILPNRMVFRKDRLVLASTMQLLAVEAMLDGTFVRGWDLGKILEIADEDRSTVEISGLNVDPEGNLLLTCAVLFRAFVVSRDGTVSSWGKAGAAPGTFGNIGGIAADGSGHTFVVDKLRGVISVFDEKFRFQMEFGGDPSRPGRLGRPSEVVHDGAGRLYVTQVGRGGVWTFDIRPQ
ncbi:MAG TPA: hypothetical protein VJ259_02490 [Actinomycetota bacterium]|nr:hypothetical protein [Actinomycetota bacterium]